ncbi:IS630 family transposase, partial [Streptococcus castoreus]
RKRGFKNKVFRTLSAVMDKLQEVIQNLSSAQLKSIVHRDWTSAIFHFN